LRHYIDLIRIDRMQKVGRVLSFGGLGVMVVALVLSLRASANMGLTMGLALVGLLASQIGTMQTRRWPKSGRSDQVIDAALKGLDGRHSLYHYLLGCRHALIAPGATLALIPVGEAGIFEWRDGILWRTPVKKGVPSGKPAPARGLVESAARETADLERRLRRQLPERETWDLVPLLVFCSDAARLERDDAHPAIHLKKLKEYVRNLPRRAPLSEAEAEALASSFLRYLASNG
jgi:hypothetical protein